MEYRELKVQEVYKGQVTRIMEYGCFVKLVECRNKEGLCHISNMMKNIGGGGRRERRKVGDIVTEGQEVTVRVGGIDGMRIELWLEEEEKGEKE